ncbi:MAG: helix-turn-helix transcriptional regulator [Rhodospirillaceae bacterium]|jgi:transcriptional regulator with XRE-family HTH domain|nr:helix-turn-helix transcriptional regulator [Rhodospirillaceae bacterium]MBT5245232.1 helix-turn-helix transcriptional regulator [Rhodospirillaceae bacterium]MBT5562763.1 helix-turn-helix transcriptional regulator [Rhodospirillaceae bacterium]MBT6241924.1 helix-turn-helix transcriptional regulator [Rhodospirillaceae bacterium]MBT7137831.1 helix-turn-helix transcriptional regulator [Rhodospirillaceae bacterium]
MAKDFDDILKKMPPKRRKKIAARGQQLIAEHLALIELRAAMNKTQVKVARELGVQQTTVSRMEKRSDMLISTLRQYIEAMGGDLDIVARFPDRPDVHIEGLQEITKVKSA